jgi:hypothetical protein
MPNFLTPILRQGLPTESVFYTIPGALTIHTGKPKLVLPPRDLTLLYWTLGVGVLAAGTGGLIDVNLNGTTIFPGGVGRPTIGDASPGSSGTLDVSVSAGFNYLTVDVDALNSTTPAEDVVVGIFYS